MKDSVLISKKDKGFTISRTMSEDVTAEQLDERIEKVEQDIKDYADVVFNMEKDREDHLEEYAYKYDKSVEEYHKAIHNLEANLKALQDAKELGRGKTSSIQEGDTAGGVK